MDALKIAAGPRGRARHRQHGRLRPRHAAPERVTRLVLMDAPVPGVGPWEEMLKNPLLWHFRFGGPDMERLVAGRERIYLDRFWNEFSANPRASRSLARPLCGALRAAGRDAFRLRPVRRLRPGRHRQPGLAGDRRKLTMPVLAIGGEKSFGPMMADGHARGRHRRHRRHRPGFGPLDHGRTAGPGRRPAASTPSPAGSRTSPGLATNPPSSTSPATARPTPSTPTQP
jgi:pimeloyl-ACP methyl ester carboxylesterase